MLQCLAPVTKYFITVTNSISGVVINMTCTNETMYTLNGLRMGDVYVVEIVPSNALGNGSATKTHISKSQTSHIKSMATGSRAGYITVINT